MRRSEIRKRLHSNGILIRLKRHKTNERGRREPRGRCGKLRHKGLTPKRNYKREERERKKLRNKTDIAKQTSPDFTKR